MASAFNIKQLNGLIILLASAFNIKQLNGLKGLLASEIPFN